MPSVNIDFDYLEHPKTLRLIGLLGSSAEVLPIRLWIYCGKFHYVDGRLTEYSAQEIESIVRWWGKPGQCIEAMLRVEFIEKDNIGFFVHDWLEHQGHIVAYKERARKMAKAKHDSVRSAASMQQASLFDASRDASAVQSIHAGHPSADFGESFPPELQDTGFRDSWKLWEHQQAQLGFPLTKATRHAQLSMLASWGSDGAIASIQESIRNGWRKLVPPTPSKPPPAKRPELPTADQIAARDAQRAKELEPERERAKQEFIDAKGLK